MRRRLRLRPLNREDALAGFAAETASCRRCALAEGRTQVVVGRGNPAAALMLVGEAPGFNEDRLGLPFAGRVGELIERLLSGIGLTLDDVYATTVVKCRPPGSRDPSEEEAAACERHLVRQIELVQPRVVATLGTFATRLLIARPQPLGEVHGQPLEARVGACTVTLLPLYHPAAVLYAPALLAALERDIATIPALLGTPAPAVTVEPSTAATTQLDLF